MRFIIGLLFILTTAAHATPLEQIIPVKEQLRLHLWHEGLVQEKKVEPITAKVSRPLPEELERALKKM